jgi:hypothetical protein
MYTKLDDQRQAKFVINYITANPGCSIKEIVQECVISRTRLKYLESQGYLFCLNGLTITHWINDLRIENMYL